VGKFGPAIARNLRQLRAKPSSRWHLDEMVVRINGRQMYLWRAVDDEGEVLEVLIQRRRNKAAARKLIRKLLRKHGFAPTRVTTDKLRSYGAAFKEIGLSADHEQGVYQNNRAEVSHQPLRRRDAAVQIARFHPALRLDACRHRQHLQPPAPSDFPPNPAHLPGAGQGRLECCDRCCLRIVRNSGPLRAFQVPVTMPRHILMHGHEPLDTDTTPTLEGEAWLMHNGYTQAEGVANLDKVSPTGCLVEIGYPKHQGGTGGYARYIAICPSTWTQGISVGEVPDAPLPKSERPLHWDEAAGTRVR
jgi:hypothetical protein